MFRFRVWAVGYTLRRSSLSVVAVSSDPFNTFRVAFQSGLRHAGEIHCAKELRHVASILLLKLPSDVGVVALHHPELLRASTVSR